MKSLHLTDRALHDILEIERYSKQRWGARVASRYLVDLEAALSRLAEDLRLFRDRPEVTGRLRFYPVREHLLVGDVIDDAGFVLAVWHGSMDLVERLADLEPDLLREAEILARRIDAERK